MSEIPTRPNPDPWVPLAGGILAAEAASPGGRASHLAATSSVISRLHGILRPLIGAGGFEAVLARAVFTTCGQWPGLARARLRPREEAWADSLEAAFDGLGEAALEEATGALVAGFLGALARVVGRPLTLVLLRDLWPEVVPGPPPPETDHNGNGAAVRAPADKD